MPPLSWVISAARRMVPSPPMTSASSQSSPAPVSVSASSSGGSNSSGRSPRSAASSASSRTTIPCPVSALTKPRATSRASSRPVCASSSTRRGGGRRRGRAAGRAGRRLAHGSTLSPGTPRGRRPGPRRRCARRRRWPGRGAATGRTRRCPTDPAAGWWSTIRAPQPRRAAASATATTASARSPGSRTTPPLPTPVLADLELGLHHQRQVAVRGADPEQGVQHELAGR